MVDILLCGDPADTALGEALLPALSLYGGVCFCGGERVLELGVAPRFFLCELGRVPEIALPSGILILKDSVQAEGAPHVPENFICVMSSGNAEAARILCGSGAAAVTCGTGPRDTLSLAAAEPAEASVSLQRSLRTLGGSLLEPRDFRAVLTRPLSPRQILFTSTVLLLSDTDPEQDYIL